MRNVLFFVMLSSWAMAGELCFTGASANGDNDYLEIAQISEFDEMLSRAQPFQVFSCEAKYAAEKGLQVLTVTFMASEIALRCSVVGAPTSIAFGVAGIVTYIASAVVSDLPCRDSSKKTQKQEICELMRENGYKCDPGALRLEE